MTNRAAGFTQSYGGTIKTHSSVSAAKKTKEDVQHTSVLFTGTIKFDLKFIFV